MALIAGVGSVDDRDAVARRALIAGVGLVDDRDAVARRALILGWAERSEVLALLPPPG